MVNIDNACCFTGYRPEKFPFPFETECAEYREFQRRLSTAISDLINGGCHVFYCGMAQGFDIVAGEYVALIKKLNKNLRLIGVVPFDGQEKGWRNEWRDRYKALLGECNEVIVLNNAYSKWAFGQRNRYMVDRSRYVLTYFDGKKGGTDNTVKYAVKHSREVINIFETDPLREIMDKFKLNIRLYPPE